MNNSFYEELEYYYRMISNDEPIKQSHPSLCDMCNIELIDINSFPTCQKCGTVFTDRICDISDNVLKKRSVYKRRLHFIEKLNLIACYKSSNSSKYKYIIDHLKKEQFGTIEELRQLLYANKYSKFYDYIYNIFNDIKGRKAINITRRQIQLMSGYFIKFEHKFKSMYKCSCLPYSFVIYKVLKEFGFNDVEHVLTVRLDQTKKRCNEIWDKCKP